MQVNHKSSIAFLKRTIESLKLEEQRLTVLTFGSPHDVNDLQVRLREVRHKLDELTGQLPSTERNKERRTL